MLKKHTQEFQYGVVQLALQILIFVISDTYIRFFHPLQIKTYAVAYYSIFIVQTNFRRYNTET